MSRTIRIAVGSAALAAGLAIAGASPANAQVRVRGSFPLPHGRIQVDIGDRGYDRGYDPRYDRGFPIGGYVPDGYEVYEDPYAGYGYGFEYEDQWIRCEPRGTRWIIVAAPVYYGHGSRYSRPYRNDSRVYRQGYGDRNYRRDNRTYRRDDRGSRDNRSYRRNDRRNSGPNRRW